MAKKKDSDKRVRAWVVFLATHTMLLERIEAALSKAKLPPLTWYDVLWELDKAESHRLRMHDLAERVILTRFNLTRLADRLEKLHLIKRERSAEDRRGAYCVITPAGLQLRKRMWPVYRQQLEELFTSHLSQEEAETMIRIMERMRPATRKTEG